MYGIRCRPIIFVLCYVVQAVLVEAGDPPGHLQPIGSHMPPMHIEERNDFPNPIEFYDNYVAPGKPVLFKGAAKQFPSYNNWKNDSYLSEVYGSMYMAAETAKKEDRNNPIREMNFTTFLSLYEEEDIYMVQYLTPPQPITKEMFVPKSLLCPGFLELLNMALLWFSSGGTKSVLHNDSFENINCLFDGTKELIMIDRKHKELVPIDNMEKGYSSVDVERVDMYKYPTLSKLPWYIANMDTGDCLYIPMKWYHHVNSSL
uniref:JmjC domain-containing protein n=1 Tax=Ciona savignyi TaxID=51511 RepID=H2YG19_CIOSA